MKEYQAGDTVRFNFKFDRLGTAVNPTAITLKIKDPGATITNYTYAAADITRTATGEFYFEITCSTEGVWSWQVTAAGTANGVERGKFLIRPALA